MHILRKAILSLAAASLLVASVIAAEDSQITLNYKDADLREVAETIGEITGRTFIIDPRLKGRVTVISKVPMDPGAVYETFLSILQVQGYVAIPSGNVVKIVPEANARQLPADAPTSSQTSGGRDAIITRVVQVENVAATQLVPLLRPLIPQYGHLAAHPASNMLIISDRAANVDRMVRIIQRIDQSGDEDIEVMRLEHATAADVVRIVSALNQTAAQAGGQVSPLNLVADDRTNSVLISGDKSSRLRIRTLITHLDTPLEEGGDTEVVYLNYAQAEGLAQILNGYITGQQAQTSGQPGAGAAGAGRSGVSILADTDTNSLVITAPPRIMRNVKQVISKLDVRPAQVLIEAYIVEVTMDDSANLGVTWAVDATSDVAAAAITNFGSAGILNIGGGIASATSGDGNLSALPVDIIPNGITIGTGRIKDSGTNFAVIVNALMGDAETNTLSLPGIITLDNQEAELRIGQQVPFVTGQFTSTGAATTAVNPFQTIQREDVGITLRVTPQINEGNAVKLEIFQESSSLSPSTAPSGDPITNERSITTNVIVDDGDIIVLGGLIDDQLLESEQRVPGLGRIPGIGALFRSTSTTKTKQNLMVFLRPKILRDGAATAVETNAKYEYLRDLQLERSVKGPALMRDAERPVLPPLNEVTGLGDSDDFSDGDTDTESE